MASIPMAFSFTGAATTGLGGTHDNMPVRLSLCVLLLAFIFGSFDRPGLAGVAV